MLVVLCVVAGVVAYGLPWVIGTREGRDALVVWTFDRGTAESIPGEMGGRSVRTTLTPAAILAARLGARDQAYRQSGVKGTSHLVEIELNSFSQFQRGEETKTFLSPIDEGLPGGIPASRAAAWRYRGVLLALPRDVHAVFIGYRPDLWEAAGIDPARCGTWEELLSACGEYERTTGRKSMELPRTSGQVVWMMLQQGGWTPVDETGRPYLTEPRVGDVIAFYAGKLAGDIGVPPARAISETAEQLEQGEVAMVLLADWRLGQLRAANSAVCGKLRLMPLPVFVSGDRRTATWGGTGLAIPADTPDAQASRALLERIAKDRAGAMKRYHETLVFPADSSLWSDAELRHEDGVVQGLPVLSELLRELSGEVPAGVMVGKTQKALMELNLVTTRAVYEARGGLSGEKLRSRVQEWLEGAQGRLLEE
jgi:hypothetical protein